MRRFLRFERIAISSTGSVADGGAGGGSPERRVVEPPPKRVFTRVFVLHTGARHEWTVIEKQIALPTPTRGSYDTAWFDRPGLIYYICYT